MLFLFFIFFFQSLLEKLNEDILELINGLRNTREGNFEVIYMRERAILRRFFFFFWFRQLRFFRNFLSWNIWLDPRLGLALDGTFHPSNGCSIGGER